MNTNIGTADRNARVIIGMVLIAAAVFGFIGMWGFIGVVAVITGLVRYCPAYKLLGYTSCPIPTR
jgi:hypothetical protein